MLTYVQSFKKLSKIDRYTQQPPELEWSFYEFPFALSYWADKIQI